MASIYDLKPKFQASLRPLVNRLAALGVTANQITILAIFLSFATGACIALFPQQQWPLLAVPIVLFVRMALNAVDGMLAREHNMKSSLGAVLNELGDVVSDAVLYLPFAFVPGINATLIVIVTLLAVISEMAGVVAVQIGAQRRYDGPMGKSDRAFVFGLIGLIVGLGFSASPWVDYLLAVLVAMLFLTIANRIRRALGEVS